MQNYLTKHTTDISIEIQEDIYLWIDGEDMSIFEVDGKMTDAFFRYIFSTFTQLKSKFDEDTSW